MKIKGGIVIAAMVGLVGSAWVWSTVETKRGGDAMEQSTFGPEKSVPSSSVVAKKTKAVRERMSQHKTAMLRSLEQ